MGEEMKLSKDELTFPHFQTYSGVVWDEEGFGAASDQDRRRWSDVEQVALIWEMTPTLAIVEPDTYIGFA